MPGPRVSQFEQTVSGLLGISKQEQRYLPACRRRPKPQMAAQLVDHTAAAVMAPACSSGVAPQAHGFTLGRPHLYRRLASNFSFGDCSLLLFAPTAAACSASGVSCTSPGSLRSALFTTLLSSGVSKNFSSLSLLLFSLEENGKLLNFFVGLAVSWSHLQSIELGRQTHGRAGCEELRVLAKKQAGPGQARRRLVAHPDTRGRVAVAWPPVANLGQ